MLSRATLCVLVTVFVAFPPSAGAATTAIAREATIAKSSRIPTPDATILEQGCPDGGGPCSAGRLLYIPRGTSAFSREHELGHAFDAQYLDAGERFALQHRMGLPDGPWIRGTGMTADGYSSPSEWMADAYAACRLGLIPGRRWTTAYGYEPTKRQHRVVCGTLSRAGRDLA